jgi:hypothetical protein
MPRRSKAGYRPLTLPERTFTDAGPMGAAQRDATGRATPRAKRTCAVPRPGDGRALRGGRSARPIAQL